MDLGYVFQGTGSRTRYWVQELKEWLLEWRIRFLENRMGSKNLRVNRIIKISPVLRSNSYSIIAKKDHIVCCNNTHFIALVFEEWDNIVVNHKEKYFYFGLIFRKIILDTEICHHHKNKYTLIWVEVTSKHPWNWLLHNDS